MTEKVPKNKFVNPYRRSQRELDQLSRPEEAPDPPADAPHPQEDSSEAFMDVFNVFRGEEDE